MSRSESVRTYQCQTSQEFSFLTVDRSSAAYIVVMRLYEVLLAVDCIRRPKSQADGYAGCSHCLFRTKTSKCKSAAAGFLMYKIVISQDVQYIAVMIYKSQCEVGSFHIKIQFLQMIVSH